MSDINEVAGRLASGGRYRATSYSLEFRDSTEQVIASYDTNEFTKVARSGQTLTISRRADAPITVTALSLDDAGRLEGALKSTIDSRMVTSTTATPAKSDRSTGRTLLLGALGCVGVVVLGCVGFFAFALLLGDDENDSPAAVAENGREITEGNVAQIGDSVVLPDDGWIITVTDVRKTKSTEFLLSEERALGVYVIVDMLLENTANDAHKLTGQRFKIVDDRGREYEWFSRGTIGYGQQELGSNINAGLSGPATILFDLPEDATGLTLESLGGFRVRLGDVQEIPQD